MELLSEVEESLRGLSVEARKNLPDVKEAAERGTLKLRSLKEGKRVNERWTHFSQNPHAEPPR